MKIVRYIIISLLCLTGLSRADTVDYGLSIQSFPLEKANFSSLILEDGEPIRLGDELSMSFRLLIRKDNIFGLVFRILTDNEANVDLMLTTDERDGRHPMLVVGQSPYQLPVEVRRDTWLPVEITLSPKSGTIRLLYDTTALSIPASTLADARSARISFGVSPFEGFELNEIASIDLRDVRLTRESELIRYWRLERHADDVCYDSVDYAPARVINPSWKVDKHLHWVKLYSGGIPENTLFAFNPGSNEFHIVPPNSNEIQIFNAEKRSLFALGVKGGRVASNAPNQLVYDAAGNRLLSYNLDERKHSAFTLGSDRWDHDDKPTQEHKYWNNTSCLLPEDSLLLSFGGYGFYRYTNELIYFNPYADKIERTELLREIDPRYCPASTVVGDTLYIFGGRGCESGRQELYPHYYYDLYAVDLKTARVRKVWEASEVEDDFLPADNLLYDECDRCFYTLAITAQGEGLLLRIDPTRDKPERIALPLDEHIESHYIYANLYYSPASRKLYALINQTKANKASSVSIHSISFPPLPAGGIFQEEERESRASIYYGIGAIIAILLGAGLFLLRRRAGGKGKTRKEETQPEAVVVPHAPQEDTPQAAEERTPAPARASEHPSPYYDFSRQSVSLLGGFRVKDKSGSDITGLFTPMLKQLFTLLILYSVKQENGISGAKLIQCLWSDKTEESGRNNRNVYLSKLRVLLEKVGGIEIVNRNNSWTIRLDEGTLCDYVEATRYLRDIEGGEKISRENLNKLLELLLRGTLLPNLETDWVDGFKSDFSSQTIDILTNLLNDTGSDLDDSLKSRVADTLFLHDYINEDALYTKLTILYKSGKKGLAKNIYDNFRKEYRNLLDTDYEYSLSDVIHGKNRPAE